jgi:hypothetical protein
MTFETVGTDTPACSAMNAIVVGRRASPGFRSVDDVMGLQCSESATLPKVSGAIVTLTRDGGIGY